MVTTDIAGRFLLVLYERQADGTEVATAGGVFKDKWLAFQTGYRTRLNREGVGRLEVEVYDPLDGQKFYSKDSTKKQEGESLEKVSAQARS